MKKSLLKIEIIFLLLFLAQEAKAANPTAINPIVCLKDVGREFGFENSLNCVYLSIVSFSAIAALVRLVWAGVLWAFAGENVSRVEEAKSIIRETFWGLAIVLTSYIVLLLIVGRI